MPVTNVAFTAPTDYTTDQQAIQRRLALAQAMQSQGMAPIDTNNRMAGALVSKVSPWEGIGKLFQAYAGTKGVNDAQQQEKDLTGKYNQGQADALAQLLKDTTPTPAMPEQVPATPNDDDGNPNPSVAATPAYNPTPADVTSAIARYGISSGRPDMGAQYAMSHAGQAAMIAQMMQADSPATSVPGTGAAKGDVGPTNTNAARINPTAPATVNGGIPRNLAFAQLMSDPTGKSLASLEADLYKQRSAPKNMRAGSTLLDENNNPIFTAPTGGMQTTWNGNQPTASLVPNAQELAARQAGLTTAYQRAGAMPYEPPQSVNTDGAPTMLTPGQQISLATGAPPPAPNSLFPPPGAPSPQGMPSAPMPNAGPPGAPPGVPQGTPAPTPQFGPGVTPAPSPAPGAPVISQVPAAEAANAQAALAASAQGRPFTAQNPTGSAPPAAIQRGPGGMGFRLQDQGASKQQQTEGERAGGLTYDAPAARATVADASANLDRLIQQATLLKSNPALGKITGVEGMFPNMPGGQASDTAAQLNSLKSQVGFSVLQAMRNASKTGGALGAISDKENELLQRNLAALDTNQSPEGMRNSLQQVIDYSMGAKQRLLNAYNDQYVRMQGNQGMQPTNQGAVPAANGYTIRRVN